MEYEPEEYRLNKEDALSQIIEGNKSAFRKYKDFYIGKEGFGSFVAYEMAVTLLAPLPGAAGILLRKIVYPSIFKKIGSDFACGRNIALRHPGKITIGDRVAIDDSCLLDARGGRKEGIVIGNDVLIARSTLLQAKVNKIVVGNKCSIGSQCQLSSTGGIILKDGVLIAGQCYIGGGRYNIGDPEMAIMDQGMFTRGPVWIENNVWVGADVVILDGIHIGKGAVIAAGSVVTKDVEPRTIVGGIPAKVMRNINNVKNNMTSDK